MITKYANGLIRWRWLAIVATFVWVGLAASGMRLLQYSDDYLDFFSADNPQLQDFEDLQETYDKSDNILIVLTPKDGNVFSVPTLTSLQWITDAAWQTPHSARVDSITNYQHTEATGDDLAVADLVGDLEDVSSEQLQKWQNIAVSEPLLRHRLINADASVTAVNITIQLPGKSLTELPDAVSHVRGMVADLEARDPNLEARLTGVSMMSSAFSEASQKDLQTLIPLMFLIVIVALGLLLRSVSASLTTVLVIFMSILVGMGLFGWTGLRVTAPIVSAPIIILTMAVADSVHILVSLLHGMRRGLSKHDAIVESLRINAQPVFITSLTTAIGFLTLNFSEVPPLRYMGNIVVVGVLVAWVLSMTLLPALMAVLPVQVKQSDNNESAAMNKLSSFVIAKHRPLLWSMALISVGCAAFLPRNEINDEFVKYFDEKIHFRTATDYAAERLIGPYNIEFSIGSGEDGGISDPDYLQRVQAFVDYAHSLEMVTQVQTLTDVMKRLNKNMHGDDESWYKLPEERDLSAQYLLLYEMSLPYGLDLNNQIDVAKSSTRVIVNTENMSSKEVIALEQDFATWFDDNAPGLDVSAASTNLMFAHIGQRNAESMVNGVTIALILISLILVMALRSVKIGLLSMIPNLIPGAVAFGIWGMFFGNVGMSVAVVASMTLGIVVDDTVHFLSKFLRAKREQGLNTEDAIRYAFNTVGVALIVTTIVLVSGFAILMFSSFKLNSDMGLLTAITIAIALIIDFFLLPPILLHLKGKDDEQNAAPSKTKAAEEELATA